MDGTRRPDGRRAARLGEQSDSDRPGGLRLRRAGGGTRLQIPLGRWVFASFQGSAVLNLVRRGLFVKGEEDAVFREPLVGAFAGAGLGLSF